ncbi:MAG: MBL fold metallo-hydrolase [Candidatus Jettenia sp.]|uniref:Putative hydroxyacylglutathione hydrolase n=1 Tax=Candidatus Jettenia caeni TaxID=247490 RepID=I3IHN1_9BACT|nr:MBL fold metallo-hydrolase [Candidatus Jettenia sp. AMX1]MBC6928506.1 MBL fold metallo-hydrolase [Candidatus Jettenia sp.]NUN22282.1 MBL fold metallo-hydrolase [Candidatus Jettenia caeni]KAA0251646.1 MAG: MBL fold metallo-hydrolase [Candidatus Jettenia sp. AMX1]MCE7879818.1 MBL fold metallo-hydrolase [Candidatus Jettenia sp. AMX1]MCQ3925902.1 MBL fold metallo-hydrolase [Candidatus Jettenia sp.]
MFIHKIPVGPLKVCCYIVAGKISNDAMIIDPGADAEAIIDFLKKGRLTPKIIVLTHGHGDHIGANTGLKKAFPDIQICIHEEDQDMLPYPAKNLSILSAFYGGPTVRSPLANRLLRDGDTITVDEHIFDVIHTPGHTPGGICLSSKKRENGRPPILFSGDTLFKESIGRTDFPGSDQEKLLRAIKERLFVLDEDTIVYPGHGPSTTILEEKKHNPFVTEVTMHG